MDRQENHPRWGQDALTMQTLLTDGAVDMYSTFTGNCDDFFMSIENLKEIEQNNDYSLNRLPYSVDLSNVRPASVYGDDAFSIFGDGDEDTMMNGQDLDSEDDWKVVTNDDHDNGDNVDGSIDDDDDVDGSDVPSSCSVDRRVRKLYPDVKVYCEPTEHSVLFGRGSLANRHNRRHYIPFMLAAQPRYKKLATKSERTSFVETTVREFLAAHVDRQFLERERGTGLWYEVPFDEAHRKVGQFLRQDHSPKAREAKRDKYKKMSTIKRTNNGIGARKKRSEAGES